MATTACGSALSARSTWALQTRPHVARGAMRCLQLKLATHRCATKSWRTLEQTEESDDEQACSWFYVRTIFWTSAWKEGKKDETVVSCFGAGYTPRIPR